MFHVMKRYKLACLAFIIIIQSSNYVHAHFSFGLGGGLSFRHAPMEEEDAPSSKGSRLLLGHLYNKVNPLGFVHGILPGTKWCGFGNVSDDNYDTGLFYRTDECCRQHSHCKYYIRPDESDYGLVNKSPFVRYHCECEKDFHDCLADATSLIAHKVGKKYFNIISPVCFKKEFPIMGCKSTEGLSQRCVRYKLDSSGSKEWQWFDNPFYP